MTPGQAFSLNAVEPAARAELRIFDTAGDLVIRFEGTRPAHLLFVPMDGKNGSHQSVRRGPLVAVGTLDYPDGTHDVLRQVVSLRSRGVAVRTRALSVALAGAAALMCMLTPRVHADSAQGGPFILPATAHARGEWPGP
jgi:hypothetical protein